MDEMNSIIPDIVKLRKDFDCVCENVEIMSDFMLLTDLFDLY